MIYNTHKGRGKPTSHPPNKTDMTSNDQQVAQMNEEKTPKLTVNTNEGYFTM